MMGVSPDRKFGQMNVRVLFQEEHQTWVEYENEFSESVQNKSIPYPASKLDASDRIPPEILVFPT